MINKLEKSNLCALFYVEEKMNDKYELSYM